MKNRSEWGAERRRVEGGTRAVIEVQQVEHRIAAEALPKARGRPRSRVWRRLETQHSRVQTWRRPAQRPVSIEYDLGPMRRLARQLFLALTLLLCLAVCGLWARSSIAFDHLRWRYAVEVTPDERDERSLHAISVGGRLFLAFSRETYRPFPSWEGWRGPIRRPA